MTDLKKNATAFSVRWQGKGYEKDESQMFWIDLLQNVLGVSDITNYISFEDKVKLDSTSFIDGYIEATHVLHSSSLIHVKIALTVHQSMT